MRTQLAAPLRRDRALRLQRRIHLAVALTGTAAVGGFVGLATVRNAATAVSTTTTAAQSSSRAAASVTSTTSTSASGVSTPAATVAPAASSSAATVSGGSGTG